VSPVNYELGFYIPEDDILHSHRRENLKSYIALTSWTLAETKCVCCEIRTGFFIPEDDILHSHSLENLKSCIFVFLRCRNFHYVNLQSKSIFLSAIIRCAHSFLSLAPISIDYTKTGALMYPL
jgi:hypothetical protein